MIRKPNAEGSYSLQFRHDPKCGWAIKLQAKFSETNLRKELGFDIEAERFQHLKEFLVLTDL